jgi:hypothetical protein
MSDYNATNSETSSEDKCEDKKDLPSISAETSIEGSKKPVKEKKVVVIKPGEPDVKISGSARQPEGA